MDDRLKEREIGLASEVRRDAPIATAPSRSAALPWLVVLLLLAAVAFFAWKAYAPDPDGE